MSTKPADTLSETQKTVLRQLAQVATEGRLYSALPRGCGRSLAAMAAAGLVVRRDSGHWTATDKGRQVAAALA
jgi:restriction endonuclease Mrr